MKQPSKLIGASLAIALVAALPLSARATDADLDCKMKFDLDTWSAIYKHAEGAGTVSCENGDSMNVRIKVKGGGLTVGKSHIENGTGTFTDVRKITDVLGDYAQGGAHIGVVKSGTAQLLSKGTVSLALAGKGEGVDLGVDVGKFTISRAK